MLGPPLTVAAVTGHDELVNDAAAWVERMWTGVHPEWVAVAGELTPRQRLLVGLVIFGRLRYQAVATLVGLDPALVSGQCTAVMLRLRAGPRDR